VKGLLFIAQCVICILLNTLVFSGESFEEDKCCVTKSRQVEEFEKIFIARQ
jgi:hypothetical protein